MQLDGNHQRVSAQLYSIVKRSVIMRKCCGKLRWHRQRRNDDYRSESRPQSCACKCFKWIVIIFIVLILLAFITIFVIIPVVVMENVEIQRKLMFPDIDQPSDPEYENYAKYKAVGVRNMYVNVVDLLNHTQVVSLGVWQVVPEDRVNASVTDTSFDYDHELKYSKKPVCIYFHGNSGTRIHPYPTYEKLRKFFHVLAVDYRNYGDSTEALLTEPAVVNDLVELYKVVVRITDQEIYFWGHSLGTALSTHTLRRISELKQSEQIVGNRMPRALILEAPFTTMREEIPNHPIGKIFAWLPWFEATILDPLEENGFHFWTKINILSVDCPIMIFHAADDAIIPYTLGQKLAHIARTERNLETQGNVTLHIIPASYGLNHLNINRYPDIIDLIEQFLDYVNHWWRLHRD